MHALQMLGQAGLIVVVDLDDVDAVLCEIGGILHGTR